MPEGEPDRPLLAGRYAPLAELARSPGITVLRARDTQDGAAGQQVVIKQLQLDRIENWEQLQLFEREARLLAQLDGPRLPRLLEMLEPAPGVYAMIQTSLPGIDLETRRQQGWTPTEAEVVQLAAQALSLLQSLHGAHPPIVHRDLKPANLLLDDGGWLYLIDFGAALQGLDADKGAAGTPGYMPPEQYAGRSVPASDLYALGITLIELLTGQAPRADTPPVRPEASVALANWLEVLVHPDLRLRFQDAREALEALPGEIRAELLPPRVAIGSGDRNQPASAANPAPSTATRKLNNGQYLLQTCLHIEGGVSSWEGVSTTSGAAVPIQAKLLQLSRLSSIKQLELFERELHLLQQHPDLPTPRLLAVLRAPGDEAPVPGLAADESALIFEKLPGETLQAKLDGGWRATEAELWALAREALIRLRQLHEQPEPLIHRDLRPAHLLWHQGQLSLLNFGGVQQLFRLTGSSGSTVIGSFGYTAPEQLLGRAEPASDLYALGMCLLQILTGRHPAELPWTGTRVDTGHLGVSESMRRWLAGLLEPDSDKRVASAAQALQALDRLEALYHDSEKAHAFAAPAARQERSQDLHQHETRFRLGGSAYVANQAATWTEKLASLGLPLPPGRIVLLPDTSRLMLTIPFPGPSRQPELEARVKRSLRWGRAFTICLIPALLGLALPPLMPLTLLAAGLLAIAIKSRLQLKHAAFADLYLTLTPEALICQAGPPGAWQKLISPILSTQSAGLRVPAAEAGAFTLESWQTPFNGEFWRLRWPDGRVSPPCCLRPEEATWLQQALPLLAAESTGEIAGAHE